MIVKYYIFPDISIEKTCHLVLATLKFSLEHQENEKLVKIIKYNKERCSYFIPHSFNNSLINLVLLSDLKRADVIPVHKKKDRTI